MEELKKVIKLSDDLSMVLKTTFFEEDIDMDRLTRIDVQNIYAEYVTLPVVLNKIGVILADVTEKYNLAKMDLEITEHQLKEKFYREATDSGEKLTEDKCRAKVVNSALYKVKKKQLFSKQKEMENVNSLYWALKSKDNKLDSLMKHVNPEDTLDYLTRTKFQKFNYVDMKLVKPLIK